MKSSYCPRDTNTIISKDNCMGCEFFSFIDGEFPEDKGSYECIYIDPDDELGEEEQEED